MFRLRNSVLAVLLAGYCLAQSSSQYVTPEIRRVGDKLACLCGACKNTVATCQMLECHYSLPARQRIAKMQKEGSADAVIIDEFVKREGKKALAEPPNEGFGIMALATPVLAIGAGLGLIAWFLRRYRKPNAVPVMTDEEVRQYQDQIDKEFSKLD
jgi:cytochrome c-type biogenesis protein CcmH/NrfF